ncbi:MAG: hypothetical protein AMJ73_06680 [candidate division Zixibacteria bacterium SM1_73]|nr:MAG: hypothetical protein AMJ73_06680 [candidate division Zixibacteria bacterium SM1_73]
MLLNNFFGNVKAYPKDRAQTGTAVWVFQQAPLAQTCEQGFSVYKKMSRLRFFKAGTEKLR